MSRKNTTTVFLAVNISQSRKKSQKPLTFDRLRKRAAGKALNIRTFYEAVTVWLPFSAILAQESRNVTVRLNTRALSRESTGSTKK